MIFVQSPSCVSQKVTHLSEFNAAGVVVKFHTVTEIALSLQVRRRVLRGQVWNTQPHCHGSVGAWMQKPLCHKILHKIHWIPHEALPFRNWALGPPWMKCMALPCLLKLGRTTTYPESIMVLFWILYWTKYFSNTEFAMLKPMPCMGQTCFVMA